MPHFPTQLHLTFIHLLRTEARLLRLGPVVEVAEQRLLMVGHRLRRGREGAEGSFSSMKSRFT